MSDISLEITRTFDASPEDVFDAWTDPEQVAQWYGPEGFYKSEIHSFDMREGGSYSLTMNAPNGDKHKLRGVFNKVERPRMLVFTWQWEEGAQNNMMGNETLITVEFKPVGDTTEMHFKHEGFVNEAAKESHNKGWSSSFNKLEQLVV